MGAKGVYLVRFRVPNTLIVDANGESVPMEQFLQTHTPVQVTGLTHVGHGGGELTVVGLMIAEGTEKKQVKATWDE